MLGGNYVAKARNTENKTTLKVPIQNTLPRVPVRQKRCVPVYSKHIATCTKVQRLGQGRAAAVGRREKVPEHAVRRVDRLTLDCNLDIPTQVQVRDCHRVCCVNLGRLKNPRHVQTGCIHRPETCATHWYISLGFFLERDSKCLRAPSRQSRMDPSRRLLPRPGPIRPGQPVLWLRAGLHARLGTARFSEDPSGKR